MRRSSSGVRPALYPVAVSVAVGALFLLGVHAPQRALASSPPPVRSTTVPSTLAVRPATTATTVATTATTVVPPRPTPTTVAHLAGTVVPARRPVSQPSPAPPATAAFSPGQEAWLVIPSIGLDVRVFSGGQATIDQGLVTHYAAPGWRPPVAAGGPGTYWLAAHHVTHGAPFLQVPRLRPGDLVIVIPLHGPQVSYVITSSEVVGTSASYTTVYGPDTTTPRLLLQTCEGSAYRVLVHGVATN